MVYNRYFYEVAYYKKEEENEGDTVAIAVVLPTSFGLFCFRTGSLASTSSPRALPKGLFWPLEPTVPTCVAHCDAGFLGVWEPKLHNPLWLGFSQKRIQMGASVEFKVKKSLLVKHEIENGLLYGQSSPSIVGFIFVIEAHLIEG